MPNDSLMNVTRIASRAMEASQIQMRISAENMANAKSSDYVPQSVEFKQEMDKNGNVKVTKVKKIHQHNDRVQQIHDPNHPASDDQGMVTLPKIDPLLSLMDLQESKQAHERALKVYETATDLKQKMIRAMGG